MEPLQNTSGEQASEENASHRGGRAKTIDGHMLYKRRVQKARARYREWERSVQEQSKHLYAQAEEVRADIERAHAEGGRMREALRQTRASCPVENNGS